MNVAITPWKRYGHDRLYVTVNARKLGYRDNTTGVDHPADPADAILLTELVDAHLRDDSAVDGATVTYRPSLPPSRVGRLETDDATTAVEAIWTDLAAHQPGQLARERAEEEWEARKEAHPIRSRLGRLLNVHTDERAWRIGADGEEAVGEQLEKLTRKDPRWRVLHAVPVGDRGSDIDHLVIGPAGVFTINAKHHPGAKIWVGKDQLRVNGHIEPYIRNSRFEAMRAIQILTAAVGFEVPVDALIILFGVEDITIKTEPGEKDGSSVHVKYRRQAVRWLGKQSTRLTDAQVEAVYEQARRSTTWVLRS
ncbi:nuclease-related domain-containing protein [Nocardioides sp. STR2]|uniref:Nuclease-related domain-containing protein n=1 Tax=Nocardioides pini TaxID=2975053 RepID=A0ABT4C8V6_9ACTN|nr:nuclease-related domain-containing protein [Nocardioides pini]MCY4725392.1 nuclease-related domain-containing protein [Nocardioides pini]